MSASSGNIPAGEQELIDALVVDLIAKNEKEHKVGTVARRDVHSKSNGLFKAKFQVHDNLPEHLRVGLFAEARTYDALVRLSNGGLGTAADAFPNIRGFAIKLYGVAGDKVLPGDEQSSEHDMLLANSRTFFTETMEQMAMLMRGQMKLLFKTHPRIIGNLAKAMLKWVKNPLQISYFSQVPYAFGSGAAKYAVVPEKSGWPFAVPKIFDKDFLRHGAERLLRRDEQKFTFYVQLQRDETRDPIEDSSVEWRGPLTAVATLTMTKVTSAVQESDGEELSFHPWRAPVEHRPLGWPGRLRRAIYSADFRWRSTKNGLFHSQEAIAEHLANKPGIDHLVIRKGSGFTTLPPLPPSILAVWLEDCADLSSLDGLPDTVLYLLVYRCPALQNMQNLPSTLRELVLDECTATDTVPPLPATVWSLAVRKLPALKALPAFPDALTRLDIDSLPGLESVKISPGLRDVRVSNCAAPETGVLTIKLA